MAEILGNFISPCNYVVFAWITWMAIYLTGAISGNISVKESTLRVNVGGWLTCTVMYVQVHSAYTQVFTLE
ncbi:hypothetical protein ACROYT_G019072 [Oculina patagonica]